MNAVQLSALLEEGEGLRVEFKRKVSSPEKIARGMIAFANTRGGTMLFGIDDDRTIVGVESEKGELELIRQAAEYYAEPPIRHTVSIFSHRGKDVLCIHIPESDDKPHFLVHGEDGESHAYVRVGENSVRASREMIAIWRHRKSGAPARLAIGEAERRLFAYFETHERIGVKEYANLINVSERRASRLLIRLVKAGVLAIHTMEKADTFSLIERRGE